MQLLEIQKTTAVLHNNSTGHLIQTIQLSTCSNLYCKLYLHPDCMYNPKLSACFFFISFAGVQHSIVGVNTTILSFQVPSVHILGNDSAPFNSEGFNHASQFNRSFWTKLCTGMQEYCWWHLAWCCDCKKYFRFVHANLCQARFSLLWSMFQLW
jgi:hypothetical protein